MTVLVTRCGALLLLGVAVSGCASGAPDALALTRSGEPALQPPLASPSDLDGAIRQAQLQRVAGDLAGATRTLSQLVLAAPDDPRVIGEYGKTLVARGEPDDALAFLGQAVALQPNDWTLYSAQGVAYDQRGDYPSALIAYQHALSLKPEEPSVLSNAGLSRLQAGDLVGAELFLRAALKNGGDNARIGRNLALLESLKETKARVAVAVPAPTDTAQTTPPAEAPVSAPVADVTQAPLAEPAAPQASKAPRTGIAALAADPTVVMAPIPHDDADDKPAKKPVSKPAASSAPQKLAADSDLGLKLRPAQ